jgi:hypothetical protein
MKLRAFTVATFVAVPPRLSATYFRSDGHTPRIHKLRSWQRVTDEIVATPNFLFFGTNI